MIVYFALFFQQLIASTTHLIAQNASTNLPPNLVLLYRCVGASIVFVPILTILEKRLNFISRLERADLGRMVLLGLLNVPINQLLYLNGMEFTSPANSALLYSMTPALVFLFTLNRKKERPSWLKIFGITLAFLGAALIMFEQGASLHSEHTTGNLLIFIAVIAWSLYTMLGRPLVQKYGAVYTTGVNVIFGTILYIPIGLCTIPSSAYNLVHGSLWLDLAYLAAVSSVINYMLWFYALSKLETTKVAIFQNLQPVLTTTMAIMLGRVVMTAQLWGGGIMALIGVLAVQLG